MINWIESVGGPLIVVPVTALDDWHGCFEDGTDYDRACAVNGYAGVIPVGSKGAEGLVLGDGPDPARYLPDERAFVRWTAADDNDSLIAAARALIADPTAEWDDCGIWTTDGPAILMDSAQAGNALDDEEPGEHAVIPIGPGRWQIRTAYAEDPRTMVNVVRLLPL